MVDERLSSRIREVRTAAGLRQRDLAEQVGISPSQLSNIEKGRRSVQTMTLRKIAIVMNIRVGDLFDDTLVGPSNAAEGALLTAYRDLPVPVRRSVVQLIENIGKS